jgi:hypothetical protein
VVKEFKSALVPNVSRPPKLDGLAASFPIALDDAGAFKTRFAMKVPGYHGLEPELQLVYDSAAGPGIAGVGWSMSVPLVIQRMSARRGTPGYDDEDVFFLNGAELVPCVAPQRQPQGRRGRLPPPPPVTRVACQYPVSNQPTYRYYFTRRESYQRIAFDTVQGDWHVWTTEGLRYDYSLAWLTAVQRLPNRWFVTRITDPLGNFVQYEYQSCDAPPKEQSLDPALIAAAAGSLSPAQSAVPEFPRAAPARPTAPADLAPRAWRAEVARLLDELKDKPRELRALAVDELARPATSPSEQPWNRAARIRPEQPAPSQKPRLRTPAVSRVEARRLAALRQGNPTLPSKTQPESKPALLVADTEESADVLWRERPATLSSRGRLDERLTAEEDTPWLKNIARFKRSRSDTMTVEFLYPRRISYGRTTVDFYLEGRPDPMTFGIGDQTLAQMSCRLHSIDVRTADTIGNDARVRTVELEYEHRPDTLRSFLKQVHEFGSDALIDAAGRITNAATATALPKATLASQAPWNVGAYSFESQTVRRTATSSRAPGLDHVETTSIPYVPAPDHPEPALAPIVLDINGDGLQDQVLAYYRDVAHNDFRLILQPFLGRSSGGFDAWPRVETGLGRILGKDDRGGFLNHQVGDVDGDGRADIVWAYDFRNPADPQPWTHFHVAVTRFDEALGDLATTAGMSLDWPVAGLIARPVQDHPRYGPTFAVMQEPSQYFVTDVNGDGLDDILILSNLSGLPDVQECRLRPTTCLNPFLLDRRWHLIVALSQGDGTFTREVAVPTPWGIRGALAFIRNPNGRAPEASGTDFGPGFFASAFSIEAAVALFQPGGSDRFLVADMNGDGRGDLVSIGRTVDDQQLQICTASPRSALSAQLPGERFEFHCNEPGLPPLNNKEIYVPGDVDGDGRADRARLRVVPRRSGPA